MVSRGAHASRRAGERVLAVAKFSLHLLILPLGEKGKFVSARRRNQHAWRRALPNTSPDLNFDRQEMIDHVTAAIGIAM